MSNERGDSVMESNVRVLAILPKNKSIEQRITVKDHSTRSKLGKKQAFIDIREWWYKDGPTEEAIATRKGTMIHRKHMGKLIAALMAASDVDDISPEKLSEIKTQLARLEGRL